MEDTVLVREVQIDDGGIRLGQLLKLADLVETGGAGKVLLAEGAVTVNGEPDTRRGRQLVRGDVVSCEGQDVRLV